MARKVRLDQLGSTLTKLIGEAESSVKQAIVTEINDLPRKARNAALSHYGTVLGAPTGTLRRGIDGLARTEGNVYYAGLQVHPGAHPRGTNRTLYGRFLEYGTKHIRERRFLRDPLKQTVAGIIDRLRKTIGFKR